MRESSYQPNLYAVVLDCDVHGVAVVPEDVINNNNLTFGARGLYCYMIANGIITFLAEDFSMSPRSIGTYAVELMKAGLVELVEDCQD